MWQVPPCSPSNSPRTSPIQYFVIPSARLAIVASPASPIPTVSYFNSFYHSHLLPIQARLVIVAGLA